MSFGRSDAKTLRTDCDPKLTLRLPALSSGASERVARCTSRDCNLVCVPIQPSQVPFLELLPFHDCHLPSDQNLIKKRCLAHKLFAPPPALVPDPTCLHQAKLC
jgi:hypothetical protein